jgi:outer membrane protein assembly factor BamB
MSSPSDQHSSPSSQRDLADLIFVGFNSRVAALDRQSGELVWKWKSPKGSGFTAVLLDGDRLIVSMQGYTYCLDPLTGDSVWFNPLTGMGVGLPCLASVRGNTTSQLYAVLAEYEHQQQQQAQTHAG